ncbi:MAG: hypothetical protein AAFP20_21090 [Cyanobacteria bacterium J06614_10]
MTLPPKTVTVKCPQCEQIYIDWLTPAVGEQTEWSQRPSTVCSQCGHRSILEELQEREGVFQQV